MNIFAFFSFMQVIRRLRERVEPIRLFGESDYDAFQRLRKIEILTPEVNKVGLNRFLRNMPQTETESSKKECKKLTFKYKAVTFVWDAIFKKLIVFVFFVKGLRNDLKAAMDKIDQQYLNEIVGATESGDVDTQHDLKVHEENTTIEELEVHCLVKNNSFIQLKFVLVNIKTLINVCI